MDICDGGCVGSTIGLVANPFTIHGQCGILDYEGYVENDTTINSLVKKDLSYFKSVGADGILTYLVVRFAQFLR